MEESDKPITLKTLGKLLGLTPSSVSKALRDSTDISEKTRIRVKKAAQKLGYQPNIMARSLIKQRSNILGVIVPDFRVSFFTELTRGIYEYARELNYETIIMAHDENVDTERRNLEFLSALNVDGILIDTVPGITNNALLKRIHDRGIPIVCYDRIVDGLEFNAITIDDEGASFKVIEHFVHHGRKDIIFLGPTKNLFVAQGRYRGYRKALAQFCIDYRSDYVIPCKIDKQDAYVKMKRFIASGKKFDAVICIGGLVAYGAGAAILNSGLQIPEDISLAEFGDNNIVHRLGVEFTTVNQFPYQMGQKAVAMIVELVEKKREEKPIKHELMDTQLVFHHRKNYFRDNSFKQ